MLDHSIEHACDENKRHGEPEICLCMRCLEGIKENSRMDGWNQGYEEVVRDSEKK